MIKERRKNLVKNCKWKGKIKRQSGCIKTSVERKNPVGEKDGPREESYHIVG
jgi:hypothetical protein